MIDNVVLEKLDANMEEATIGAWRVEEGSSIAAGQALVELITDKITFDYESPVGGCVRRLVAAPGSVVPVVYVLCQVGDATAELPAIDEHNAHLLAAHRRKQEVAIKAEQPAARPRVAAGERVRATPAARRLAKEHGLELADVAPAEPGGIVTEDDVARHLRGS